MGKLSKYLFGIMAAAMLAGCSDDAISPDDNGGGVYHGPESSVYMQVTIVPTGGASASRGVTTDPDNEGYTTSSNGYEIGNEDENRIFNVMLILAGPKNEFISYALIGGLGNNNENLSGKEDNSPGVIETNPKNNSVTANASFSRASIEEFYNYAAREGFSPDEVYVYALCNYTQDMLNAIKTATPLVSNWTNLNQRVDEYSANSGIPNIGVSVLSTTGGLYMANAVKAQKQFPAKAADWDSFSDEKHPFDLSGVSSIYVDGQVEPVAQFVNTGAVRVERGMARFDFADGSPLYNGNGPEYHDPDYACTYNIGSELDEDQNTKNTLRVKLVRMCLVNMSNRFFYLRHMAETNGEEGMLSAAVLPKDDWIPEDPVEALASTFFLCVAELPWGQGSDINWKGGNWVIDPYYTFKSTFASIDPEKAKAVHYERYFNFPLGNRGFKEDGTIKDESWGITPSARDGWYTSKISDVLEGAEDQNFNNWSPDVYDYRIWRYVTENTIPSVAAQKNAISTGIVFKGLLMPGENCPPDLKSALTTGSYSYDEVDEEGNTTGKQITVNSPNLYLYDEVLYVSWINVEKEALEHKAGSPLYNAVFGNTPMTADGKLGALEGSDLEHPTYENGACAARLYEYWQEKNSGNLSCDEYYEFRKKIVNNGFAIYQHSGQDDPDKADLEDSDNKGGYFCYYYYWNRHNDNARNGVMGPMEFQVVRNNVYKLAVTEISKIGHPRRTSNDPDPEEPTKDDEESKLYFKVQVEVLPWTVRVNNITF